MIIATHTRDMNQRIVDFLKPYPYEVLVNCRGKCQKREEAVDTPWGRAICEGDGLLLIGRINGNWTC